MNRNLKLNLISTLEGSVLTLTCENEMSNTNTSTQTDKQILNVICDRNGNWVPEPAYFIEYCSTVATTPSGIIIRGSRLFKFLSVCICMVTLTIDVLNVNHNIEHNISSDAETLLWTPVSSILIAVCAMSSIVFLSIGYACGWFSHKRKQSHTRKAASDSSVEENYNEESQQLQTPGPLYEELQPKSIPEQQHLVELKDNVAYGPIIVK